MASTEIEIREFKSLEEYDALPSGPRDIWVIGIDRDPAPHGDGNAKLLGHYFSHAGDGLRASVASRLSWGERLFVAQGSESLTDRYGRPSIESHRAVIDAAVGSLATI